MRFTWATAPALLLALACGIGDGNASDNAAPPAADPAPLPMEDIQADAPAPAPPGTPVRLDPWLVGSKRLQYPLSLKDYPMVFAVDRNKTTTTGLNLFFGGRRI